MKPDPVYYGLPRVLGMHGHTPGEMLKHARTNTRRRVNVDAEKAKSRLAILAAMPTK